jgi:penicillin-binding protein 2
MCGKTGTVQNPHGEDHSVFIAFAPRDNPKIAIAVVVENAGYGSTWSAPIASLMVEKYIKKSISRPQIYIDRIMQANLLPGASINSSTKNKTKADLTLQTKQIRLKKIM